MSGTPTKKTGGKDSMDYNNFYGTKRIQSILRSKGGNYESLNSPDRRESLISLGSVYSHHSEEKLTNLDYENLYDIYHMLCYPADKFKLNERTRLSKQFILTIKENEQLLYDLLPDLINKNNLSN